jgi:hypothetical protein
MHRSNESIAALAAALAEAQIELACRAALDQPREVAHWHVSAHRPDEPHIPLCVALKWPRHRAQGAPRSAAENRSKDRMCDVFRRPAAMGARRLRPSTGDASQTFGIFSQATFKHA